MDDQDAPALAARVAALQSEVERLHGELLASRAKAGEDVANTLAAAQHRVRNMLAVVRAILSRTAHPDMGVDDYVAHLKGRIDTFVRLHGVLTRSASSRIDLEEMVREEFVAQGGMVASQVVIDGPPLALPGRIAELLGLAVHELAANSIKFGALAVDTGQVDVSWRIDDEGGSSRLSMRWSEAGAPTAAGDRLDGFGRALIEEGLPYQLGAETTFELRPDGLVCSVMVPLDDASPSSWSVVPHGPGP